MLNLGNRINRLKIHSVGVRSPTLPMAVKNKINQLQFSPPGMPPSAVLMIRHFVDPRLGLNGDRSQKHNHQKDWQRAIDNQLSDVYRRAVRPQGKPITGEPEAVLFSDEAEMVALLSLDVATHRLGTKWWWRSFSFNSAYVSSQLRQILLTRVNIIPAVFSWLARQQNALLVVGKLDGVDAMQLTVETLREFGFAPLAKNLQQLTEQSGVDEIAEVDTNKQASGQSTIDEESFNQPRYPRPGMGDVAEDPHQASNDYSPPWLNLLPDNISTARLSPAQCIFLAVARLLQSNPVTLRNRIFQRQVLRWWQVVGASTDPTLSTPVADADEMFNHRIRSQSDKSSLVWQSDRTDRITSGATASDWQAEPEIANADISDNVDGTEKPALQIDIPKDASAIDIDNTPDPSAVPKNNRVIDDDLLISPGRSDNREAEITSLSERGTEGNMRRGEDVLDTKGQAPEPNAVQPSAVSDVEDDFNIDLPYSEVFIDTEMAGVLFVINLLEQLDLPGAFDEQWLLERQISYWALTEVIARALLGREYIRCKRDPIWPLLAKLDGRRHYFSIAQKYRSRGDYMIPKSWADNLELSQTTDYYWAVSKNHLRLWVDKIPLLEQTIAPLEDPRVVALQVITLLVQNIEQPATIKLHQAAFKSAPLDNRAHLQRLGINEDLSRWLAFTMPYIKWYLRALLALPGAHIGVVRNTLFELSARIYISSCHIDMVADVNLSNLALRRAGLDRDPGWQVNFGRVILFHYQSLINKF